MLNSAKIPLNPEVKLANIIADNPYVLLVLEHFGIDFPLQDKSVKKICDENQLNTELFLTFTGFYIGQKYTPKTALSYTDVKNIVNYLKNSHIYYSKEIYPNILKTIEQMAGLNDTREMALVPRFFVDYFTEVNEHLDYENDVVFPYVLNLYNQIQTSEPQAGESKYSVLDYQEHHNDIEEKLNDLKNLIIKYLPQKEDRQVRRRLLFLLSELEFDLNIHSQIEDLILIPLVENMENLLNKTR
jgi:regulator of cell morphogenesis and NO signaling